MPRPVPTLVLVDDAPEVRLVLRSRLRLGGLVDVVAEGADGQEAVDLARRHQPDLMLLDVSMPVLDGLAALPEVLAVSPGTRVVMFSGFAEHGMLERARALGASDFLEKSVPLDRLLDRLLELAGEPGPEPSADEPAEPAEPDADQVLGEQIERFREVFDEAAIGMATVTLTGRLVRVNRALTHLVRRSEEELVGLDYADLAPGAGPLLADALEEIRSGLHDVGHLEHALGGGTSRRVRTTLAAVRDSRGRALYAFLQVQDVTAEQAALEELRRSEERFRLLVEAVEDYAIFMLDPEGHVVSWNAGAQRSKGWSAEEIIGQHFEVFYPDEVRAAGHPEHELRVALREGRYEEEGWRVRRDGSRFWASVLITAVFTADGRHLGFAKVTRDTTERRRLEQEREGALAALARANDELAQSLAVTAHELRTPIGLLAGSAELLSRHRGELSEQEQDELLDSVAGGAARLRRLVGDLLTAAKVQASALELDLSPVPVDRLVAGVVGTVAATAPGAEVRVEGEPGLWVTGDADRLAQALENLVLNGLRHGRPPAVVHVSGDADRVRLRVSDAGAGVPEQLRPRLFERFATAGAGGTGLGLYLVRQLARAQAGDASYLPPDEDGGPGAFVVELPRAAPADDRP